MANERELSEKLEDIARRLENCDNVYQAYEIAEEIRALSTQAYAPGNSVSWKDIKPKSTNKTYTDKKTGRKLPF